MTGAIRLPSTWCATCWAWPEGWAGDGVGTAAAMARRRASALVGAASGLAGPGRGVRAGRRGPCVVGTRARQELVEIAQRSSGPPRRPVPPTAGRSVSTESRRRAVAARAGLSPQYPGELDNEDLLEVLATAPRRSVIVLSDDGPYRLGGRTWSSRPPAPLANPDLVIKAEPGVRPLIKFADDASSTDHPLASLVPFRRRACDDRGARSSSSTPSCRTTS